MKKLLLVIDLQQSFINDKTKFLSDKINNLLEENKFEEVVFTRFINSLDSIWYKKLNYKECITEESKKIVIDTRNYLVIDKTIYSAVNKELEQYIKDQNISQIYLCGIDTECCVLKTAFDLFEKEYDVYVLKEYCACMCGAERNDNALEILKRNIGYDHII